MKTKNKRILLITLSFFIPFLILFITLYLKGIFKTRTILGSDMYEQYYPLFNYLKDVLDGKTTIFYSFNKSMGGTMFGTMFYYLSSPFNLFIKFINKNDIITFMTILVITKISLCGLTMYLYMSKKFKSNNILILTFSIAYALMGYNINYYINIMWLDVVLITPIILIGLENIIEGKKPTAYIITLFISIISNYYLSYMTCIFLVIYFIYEMLQKYNLKEDKEKIKKTTKTFLISSLLAGLMCSFFLIPCLAETKNYGRSEELGNIMTFSANYFDILSKSYIGSLDLMDPLNYSSMNTYCGTLIFMLMVLYFFNKNISKKERKLSFFVVLTLLIPCFIGVINYIWHLFTIPSCFSYRYSYLLCLFGITLSYKNINKLSINIKNIYLYLIFYLLTSLYLILITYYGSYYEFLNYKKIWITLIFVIINLCLLYQYNNKKTTIPKYIAALTMIELILNLSIIGYNRSFLKIENIEKQTKINREIVDKYYDKQYRLTNSLCATLNESLYLKYNTTITFLSTTNYNYLSLLSKNQLGNNKKTNVFMYSEFDTIIDSLIGNKIIITNADNYPYKKIDKIENDNKKYYIYNNEYALKLGYLIDNDITIDTTDDISYINILYKELTKDNDNYIDTIMPEIIEPNRITYKINTPNDLYVFRDLETTPSIKINNKKPKTLYCTENYCRIENKYYDSTIELEYTGDGSKISLKYKKPEKTKNLYNVLKKGEINITTLKDNYLQADINVLDDNKTLLMTLGYEKGFKVLVDGKNTKYRNVLGFVGIDLEKGYHNIEITYSQPYLKTGIIISIITFMITIVFIKKNNN